MDVPSEHPSREVAPSKYINPFGLDKNMAHLISVYLTNKDLINLCGASKNLHRIFYPSLGRRLMPHFLQYVVEGRLDKVEEILNRNKKLVWLHGDIADLSGRVFKRITAFQYATWALDKEMWELILKYLPEAEAYEQLMVLEQGRSEFAKIHGTRLNFAPLLDAYQKYIDNGDEWNGDKREAYWCKEVGGAQRQMLAWFVYVFCEEGKDKAWPTNDFKKNFRRDPEHLRWWFDQEYNNGKLGVKWGAGRWWGQAVWRMRRLRIDGVLGGGRDRLTTSQFMEDRANELSRLVEHLSQKHGGDKKFVGTIK